MRKDTALLVALSSTVARRAFGKATVARCDVGRSASLLVAL
ncbi:MAG TPA: hypothetical protein VJJ02_04835 [Candidatus Paceibacterota bacterium]